MGELEGKITWISEMQEVGDKKTPKVEFSVEKQDGEYMSGMVFTLFGNKADLLNVGKLVVGDEVCVKYNTKVNTRKEKRFNNISARKVYKTKNDLPDNAPDDLPF